MKLRYFILLAVIVLSGSVAQLNASCGLSRAVVHINGVMTSEQDAWRNMQLLEQAYGDNYAYNTQKGLWSSLAEVYFQKDVETDPAQSKALAYAIISGDFSYLANVSFGPQLQAAYVQLKAQASVASVVVSKSAAIASKIQTYLNGGYAVLLVPHSQGCLYANQVYQSLTFSQVNTNLKIVAVASPANNVTGDTTNTFYVTAAEDGIINALRVKSFFSGWTVLPWNVNAFVAGQTAPDGIGHSFTQVYVNPVYNAWPLLQQKINTAMGSFQPTGQLSVTATWEPTYSGIDFHMLVNGLDTQTNGPNPNSGISGGPGWATYCTALPTGLITTTYVSMIYDRGSLAQTVAVGLPWGGVAQLISAQNGFIPGIYMAPIIGVKNGVVSQWDGTF